MVVSVSGSVSIVRGKIEVLVDVVVIDSVLVFVSDELKLVDIPIIETEVSWWVAVSELLFLWSAASVLNTFDYEDWRSCRVTVESNVVEMGGFTDSLSEEVLVECVPIASHSHSEK